MSRSKLIERVAAAHTNLNTFASIVSILEGGHLYGGSRAQKAANNIIAICHRQQAILVREYDEAVAELTTGGSDADAKR